MNRTNLNWRSLNGADRQNVPAAPIIAQIVQSFRECIGIQAPRGAGR